MENACEMIHTTPSTKTDLDIGADNEGQYIILKLRYTDKGHRHITMKPEFARALWMQLEEFMETNFPAKTDNDLQARASIYTQKETASVRSSAVQADCSRGGARSSNGGREFGQGCA